MQDTIVSRGTGTTRNITEMTHAPVIERPSDRTAAGAMNIGMRVAPVHEVAVNPQMVDIVPQLQAINFPSLIAAPELCVSTQFNVPLSTSQAPFAANVIPTLRIRDHSIPESSIATPSDGYGVSLHDRSVLLQTHLDSIPTQPMNGAAMPEPAGGASASGGLSGDLIASIMQPKSIGTYIREGYVITTGEANANTYKFEPSEFISKGFELALDSNRCYKEGTSEYLLAKGFKEMLNSYVMGTLGSSVGTTYLNTPNFRALVYVNRKRQ